MTKKEVARLKLFIKTYGDDEVNSHFWLINQVGQYVGMPYHIVEVRGHIFARDALSQFSFLDTPFNQIKKLYLYISTRDRVYYF